MKARVCFALLAAALLGLLFPGPAFGAEAPSHPVIFGIAEFEPEPHVIEDLEGPCGIALDSNGGIYVGNYYHDEIDVFGTTGSFQNRLLNEEPSDGPCGLAVDASGELYVNNLHRNVLGFASSEFPSVTTGSRITIDTAHPTGVAVDPTGNLYVDDRTYIAEYQAPVFAGETPIRIGEGSLGNGYGVAVSGYPPTTGFIYAADAADDTVKVFDPATNTAAPVAEIDGAGTPQRGFASLRNAALAVDDATGHVFVTDNLQSLDFEHPLAAVDEFNAAGQYRGQLPKVPVLYASEPNGLAIDNSGGSSQGDVFVTSGNTEQGNVYGFGPTGPAHSLSVTESGAGSVSSEPAGIECGAACVAEYSAGAEVNLSATPAPGSAFAGWSGACSGAGACRVTMSESRAVGAEFEPAPSATAVRAATAAPSAVASEASAPAAQSPSPGTSGTRAAPSARHHHHRRHHARLRGRRSR
jgi:DNA-binding beta-propeller fold protein YncE